MSSVKSVFLDLWKFCCWHRKNFSFMTQWNYRQHLHVTIQHFLRDVEDSFVIIDIRWSTFSSKWYNTEVWINSHIVMHHTTCRIEKWMDKNHYVSFDVVQWHVKSSSVVIVISISTNAALIVFEKLVLQNCHMNIVPMKCMRLHGIEDDDYRVQL